MFAWSTQMHEGSLKCFEWVLNDINRGTEVGVLSFCFAVVVVGGASKYDTVTLTAG